jgi:hypothetical protein
MLPDCGWGEEIALTVADVEFVKRRITVHRNTVQVGQEFEVGQRMGKESRTVPLASSCCRGWPYGARDRRRRPTVPARGAPVAT